MPDIVVHNSMGDRVLERLEPEIRSIIDKNVFHFAVLASDPYMYYWFFLRKIRRRVSQRHSVMHHEKTQSFLIELANRSHDTKVFSFLAGNMCHYSLDSTTHPYINAMAQNRIGFHTAIERKLDRIELVRQGKKQKDLMKLFVPFPNLLEVKAAEEAVYGWNDDLYEKSYRFMKLYHWFAKDQHGILNKFFQKLPGQYSSISYSNHMCDGMDLSRFNALEKDAVDMGVRLVTGAYQYRTGLISEDKLKEIIGNRSYSGGEAEE